jgi:DNA-binding CsgD family transcriptional regulator
MLKISVLTVYKHLENVRLRAGVSSRELPARYR